MCRLWAVTSVWVMSGTPLAPLGHFRNISKLSATLQCDDTKGVKGFDEEAVDQMILYADAVSR